MMAPPPPGPPSAAAPPAAAASRGPLLRRWALRSYACSGRLRYARACSPPPPPPFPAPPLRAGSRLRRLRGFAPALRRGPGPARLPRSAPLLGLPARRAPVATLPAPAPRCRLGPRGGLRAAALRPPVAGPPRGLAALPVALGLLRVARGGPPSAPLRAPAWAARLLLPPGGGWGPSGAPLRLRRPPGVSGAARHAALSLSGLLRPPGRGKVGLAPFDQPGPAPADPYGGSKAADRADDRGHYIGHNPGAIVYSRDIVTVW